LTAKTYWPVNQEISSLKQLDTLDVGWNGIRAKNLHYLITLIKIGEIEE